MTFDTMAGFPADDIGRTCGVARILVAVADPPDQGDLARADVIDAVRSILSLS